MAVKPYKQTFNDGLITIYKVSDTSRKGVLSNPTLADLTEICGLHYGESTATYRDSELIGSHDITDTIKLKVNDASIDLDVKAGLYAVVKSFRTGREEFCKIYNSSPNYSANCMFLYMEEVRHGGY